jgi:uncharacterized Zn ribbon protein
MEMPVSCPICGEIFELNDAKSVIWEWENENSLVCPECHQKKLREFKDENMCPECNEPFIYCEGCHAQTCFNCNFNGWTYDEDGIYLCPTCSKEAHEEWLRDTDNGVKICQNCQNLIDGYCEVEEEEIWKPEKYYCNDFK